MKKIVMFTYLQRHLKKMLPLIPELQKRYELHLVLMTEEEKRIAEQTGLAFHMLDEFAEQSRDMDFDLAWGLEPLLKVLNVIHPDLFIAIEVNYILRNAVHYCKKEKIKTLIIQHGTPNPFSLHAFVPFEGDYFAAWGEYTRDILAPHFSDPSKIIITGGINFDRLATLSGNKAGIAEELGISEDKKWILFTTQCRGAGGLPTDSEIQLGVTEVTKAVLKYPHHQLIFQVHPSQTVQDISEIENQVEGHNALVLKYHDTDTLMAASDAVITFFSTTAIDAILLRKPLFLINFSEDKYFFPFVDAGAAYGAYTPETIQERFDKLLSTTVELREAQAKMAHYLNAQCDGKAFERVLGLCERILSRES